MAVSFTPITGNSAQPSPLGSAMPSGGSASNISFTPIPGSSPSPTPTASAGSPSGSATAPTGAPTGSTDAFQSGLNDVSIPTLFPASTSDSPIEAGAKTAGNFIGSAVNFGLGLAKLPFQAVHDIGADISGFNDAAQNFGGGISGYLQAAKTLAENLPGAAYTGLVPKATQQLLAGDTTGAGNTIENDPVGQVLPYLLLGREAAYKVSPEAGAAFDSGISKVSSPVTAAGSAIGNMASGAAGFAGDAARFVTSQATGLFPKTIETIADNQGAFSKENMEAIDRPTVAATIKTALDSRIDDLEESGKGYQGIRSSGTTIAVDPDYLKNLIESKTGLTVSGDGTAPNPYEIKTTGEASIRNPGDLRALQSKLLDVWQPEFAKGYLTANEFLNLRSDLAGLAKYEGGIGSSGPLQNLSSIMRGQLNTDFRGNFNMPQMTADDMEEWQKENPGKKPPKNLTELDANFASQASELKNLKAGILDKNDNLTDSAINKIANATNKGRSVFLEKLEEISPGITKQIQILKAIEDIENAEGQKVGTYARAGKELLSGGAGYALGGIPGAIAGAIFEAILASPKVAVPLLRAYGFSTDIVQSVLSQLKGAGSAINQSTVGAGSMAGALTGSKTAP